MDMDKEMELKKALKMESHVENLNRNTDQYLGG